MANIFVHRFSVSSLPNCNILCFLPQSEAHGLPSLPLKFCSCFLHKIKSKLLELPSSLHGLTPSVHFQLHLLLFLFSHLPPAGGMCFSPPWVWNKPVPLPGLSAPSAGIGLLWILNDHSVPSPPRLNSLFPLYFNTCHAVLLFFTYTSVFPFKWWMLQVLDKDELFLSEMEKESMTISPPE